MATAKDSIERLKAVLQKVPPKTLENLTADLLGRLIGVQFRRAREGTQQGGDGGVRSVAGRNLIYEARRYGENSRLNNREIRGEISQAVDRDPALEAWILVTTQEVSEQTATEMHSASRQFGIDPVILDWSPSRLPRLAALCASDPDSVEAAIGGGHRHLLKQIASLDDHQSVVESITNELETHAIGYELLRTASHDLVRDIWSDRNKAQARFSQDVAGGAHSASYISRAEPIAQLNNWFCSEGQDCRGLIVGREGMGKTWAAFGWMREKLDQLPIVILVPSSSISGRIAGYTELIALLARCLRDLDRGVKRELEYWERRVTRLLQRPMQDGPAFLVFFDGLNEQPSLDWVNLLSHWQDEPFSISTRVLVSVRSSFLSERMQNFSGPSGQPTRVEVGPYDMTPGGEFDKRLAMAGLTRENLPNSLVNLARVPRLFNLVIQLRDRLGGVQEVTVHRLLWEYGASAIPSSAFGASGWRQFVLNLAREFREGRTMSSLAEVEKISATPSTPADQVYRRVSSMVDSVFSHLSHFGDLQFEPEFVRHALGLALVRTLESATDPAQEELERFLGPIAGHDERAEVIKAAVSIALALTVDRCLPVYMNALCVSWVQSQNLPETHTNELEVLAPNIVGPLLDAIEQSTDNSSSSPRYIAANALHQVDRSDPAIVRTIAARGARWRLEIPLGRDDPTRANDKNSMYAQRRRRLETRIGSTELGQMAVLGRPVEIVVQTSSELVVVAAQLLQGRPLVEAVDFLEAGALHLAITGNGHEELRWLNALNTVDPTETAASLRTLSQNIASRKPEPGVHVDLNRRVAAILLWWIGFQEDASKASDLDPGIDRWLSYEEDYLPDPGMSAFPLERRHAHHTLSRSDMALRARIDRAKEFLVDPNISIPKTFLDDLIAASGTLDFDKVSTGVSRTVEDWDWQIHSLALARCAPDELARVGRMRIQSYRSRRGESRFGAANDVLESMPIVTEVERSALHALRTRRPSDTDNKERLTQTNLLIAEIQGEKPATQIQRIVEADLEFIDAALSRACGCPATADLDNLINQYHSTPKKLLRVAGALSEKKVTISDWAFAEFLRLMDDGSSQDGLEPVWILLGLNSPKRLGAVLEERRWSWSASKPYLENILGSTALAAANRDLAFSQFAFRLAPATLLRALHNRNCAHEDVQAAVRLLDIVILATDHNPPETRLDISYDFEAAREQVDYLFSVGEIRSDRSDNEGSNNTVRSFERVRASEQYERQRQEIGKRYFDEVMAAKRSGAHFLLKFEDPDHFEKVFKYCPEATMAWLEGIESGSPEFVRRVRRADGFFVSLCEAMLARAQKQGVQLWRKLRECLHTRFTVYGDMDRLVFALFRATSSKEVQQALEDLYEIDQTKSDRELVDLIVAARLSDRLKWLRGMVARDMKSPCPIHQKRAVFLEQLMVKPGIAKEGAWPDGKDTSLKEATWLLAQREAFAYHWLLTFAKTESNEEAHAAWRLFLSCVDRRAWSWINAVLDSHSGNNEQCEEAKRSFLSQQRQRLNRAMADNEKHWKDNFGGQRYSRWLMPWSGVR